MQKDLIYKCLGKIDVSQASELIISNIVLFDEDVRRQKLYEVHKSTKSIFLREGDLNSPMFTYKDHVNLETFKLLFDQIEHIIGIELSDIYNAILVLMPPHTSIKPHVDGGALLRTLVRAHVPIITNGKVMFNIEGNEKNMKAGEVWAINNLKTHSVRNDSDEDRIHLIFDYKEVLK